METSEMLDLLAKIRMQKADMEGLMQIAIDGLIPESLKQQIADIRADAKPKLDEVDKKIAGLEKAIRADTLKAGQTIRGTELMCEWVKAQTKWNTDICEGFIAAFPKLAEAKVTGEPTTKIVKVK